MTLISLLVLCVILVVEFVDFSRGELKPRVKACAPVYCPAATKVEFETGWSYIYIHEANVVTSISGTSEDFTGIFFESQVEVSVVRPCELQLKLRNVALRSRDVDDPAPMHFATGHDEFKRVLEERPLYFSFVDGVVGDVCADPRETPWSLNVKRAVVSAFQISAKSLWRSSRIVERDVQGDCPTDYQIDFTFTYITVKKSKDVEHCQQRDSFISGVQSTPYTSAKGSPMSPVLKSSYECEQTLQDGVIQRVFCTELHLLKSFSNGRSGAQTMTQMTLVLIDQVRRSALQTMIKEDEDFVVTSLLFDHDYGRSDLINASSAMREAESTLAEMCAGSLDDVQVQTPQLFWRLRAKLGALDYEALTKVFGKVDRICNFSPRGQKFFRDVLPMIGTVASVTLMKHFVLDHSVPEAEIDSWLSVLALHSKPTFEIIREVLPLLAATRESPKSFLSISALIHSFCNRPDVGNCENNNDVASFMFLVDSRLGHHCQTNSPEEIHMMVTMLKAVGNLGRWKGDTPVVLMNCVETKENALAVRLAAIKAYRKLTCSIDRSHLMRRFLDGDEDVEIRIAAYLALMKCPTTEIIHLIRNSLEFEKVNQVNSFVWSHLDVMRRSSNPDARLAAAILDNVSLNEKYSSDIRKFSRAFGSSAFSEILNVGASVDGAVQYSPSAFLPRSVNLNLTVHLFGRSVNLLEVDGRSVGLERLAEIFLRPEPPPDADYSSGSGSAETVDTSPIIPISENVRLNEMSEKFHASGQTQNALGDHEFSMSAKVFGQEVWYAHANNDKVDEGLRRLLDLTVHDILERLATDNSIEVSRDAVLLDASYAVPTLAGFPLMLDLNATASVHLKFGGHLDIRQMSIGVIDIEGHLRPSAAVAVRGSMLVSGYVGRSGVRLDASMTTATVLDGKLKLTSQGQVKLHLNMPKDKLEFIKASTNLVLTHWNVDRPLSIPTATIKSADRCSTHFTHQALGVALCLQLDYANASLRSTAPGYPLTGPSTIDLYLRKTDPKLTSYLVEYAWNLNDAPDSTEMILLSFRTPRSMVDREWTAEYLLNRMEKDLHLKFLTPRKKIIVKGRYFDDPTRRGLFASIDVDGREAFSFQSELAMGDVKNEGDLSYQPKVIIRVPTHTVLSLEGLVRYSSQRRNLNVDISVEKFTIKPIILRGEISTSADGSTSRYESSFASPLLNFSLKGSVNLIEDGLSSKTNLEYRLISSPSTDSAKVNRRETIDFTTKMRYTSPVGRASTSLSATVDVHASAAPEYSAIATWDYHSADGHLENTLTIDRPGGGDIVKAQIARFQQILSYNGTIEQNKVVGKLEVKFPSRDVFFLVNVDHQNTEQMLHSKMHFRGGAGKEYGVEVCVADNSTDTLMTTGFFRLISDGRATGMSLSALEERPSDQAPARYVLKADCYGRLFGDANVSLNYTNESQRLVFKHFVRLRIVGDSVKVYGMADLLLTNSRGLLVADADVNGEKYRLNGDYLRVNYTQHELTVSMRSSIPDHRYAGRFRVSTGLEKTVDFEVRSGNRRKLEGVASLLLTYEVRATSCHLAWDPDEDPTRSFNVSFRRERDLYLTHTQLDVVLMRSVAVLALDHRQLGSLSSGRLDQTTTMSADFDDVKSLALDTRLHYSSSKGSRDLSGYLDSYTPMFALQRLVLNASHLDDEQGRSWKSHGSVDVNDKFPMRISSSGKSWKLANQAHTEAGLQVETPMTGFENISATFIHDLASSETRTNARVQWTSQVEAIQLEARAVRPGPGAYDFFTAAVDVKTPFAEHRHLRVGVHHSLTHRQIESKAYWNHDGVDVFCVSVNGDAGVKGHYYEALGNVTLITPLKEFDKFVVEISHSHDSDGLRTDVVCTVPHQLLAEPLSMRLETSRVPPLLFNLDVVGGPRCNLGLGGHWNLMNSSGRATAAGGLRGRWNELMANASIEGTYNSIADFVFETAVDSSVVGLKRISMSVRNRIKRRSVESWIKMDLGGSMAAAVVDAKWDFGSTPRAGMESPRVNATVRLDTPFTLLQHASVNVMHVSTVDRRASSSLRGVWNDKSISMDNSLVTHAGRYDFEDVLLLSLPADEWSGLALSINHSLDHSTGSIKSFIHLLQVDAPIFTIDLDGAVSLAADKRRELIGQINVFSNFGRPRTVNVSVDHSDDGIEYKPLITCVSSDIDGPIVVTGYMKSSLVTKVIRLEATSQIPEFETVGLSAMYLLHVTQVDWNLATQWRNSNRVEIDGHFGIDPMAPRLNLTLLTPLPGYGVFKLDGSYDVWSARKRAEAIVIKEDWFIHMSGNGIFEPDLVDAQLSMETSNPYETHLLINLNVTGQLKPGSPSKRLKTVLSWADDRHLSMAVALDEPLSTINDARGACSLSAFFDANLGVDRHPSADLSVTIGRRNEHELHCDLLARWNKENSVDFGFLMVRNEEDMPLNCSFRMKSTNHAIPPVMTSVLVLMSDVEKHRRIEATFQVKEQKLSALWDLKYMDGGEGFNVNASLETPFEALRKVSLNGSFDASRGRTSPGTLTFLSWSGIGDQLKTSADVEYRISDDSFDVSLKADPPVLITPLFDVLAADFHYHVRTGSRSRSEERNLKMFLDNSRGHHSFVGQTSMFQGDADGFILNATLTSPVIPQLRPRRTGLHLDVDPHFDLGVVVTTNSAAISVFDGQESHSFQIDVGNVATKNSFNLAVIANSSLLFSTTCNATTINSSLRKVTARMFRTDVGLEAFVEVTSPCARVGDPPYSANVSYEVNPAESLVVLFLDATSPVKDLRRLMLDARHAGKEWDNVDLSVRVVTPIDGYDKFATAFRTSRPPIDDPTSFDLDVFVDTPFTGYENISLSERLVYDRGLTSTTNLTYDGIVAGFQGRYSPKQDDQNNHLDVGLSGQWRAADDQSTDEATKRLASMQFSWTGHKCELGYALRGALWELGGTWNYTGWKLLKGETTVGHRRSMDTGVLYGIKISNDFLQTRTSTTPAPPHYIRGQLGVQWTTKKSIVLNYGGSLTASKLEGSFNLTGNPALAQQVRVIDCHLTGVRGSRGIVASATLHADSASLVDAILEWMSDDNNMWRNRTISLDVDNSIQPFGVAVATSKQRSSANYWSVDCTFKWNLTRRDLVARSSSANVLLEFVGSSRRSPERTIHLFIRHPRYRTDFRSLHLKTDTNRTLSAIILWSSDVDLHDGSDVRFLPKLQPLVDCKAWWWEIDANKNPAGQSLDIGLRWSHPNRTLLATGSRFQNRASGSPRTTNTNLAFWWDVQRHPEKHVKLDFDFADRSVDQSEKGYIVNAVLRSPKLRKDVHLNASAALARNLFEMTLNLNYSPDVADLLSLNVALISDEKEGRSTFWSMFTHPNAQLTSGLNATWSRRGQSKELISANGTLFHQINTIGQQQLTHFTVLANTAQRNVAIKIYDDENILNPVQVVLTSNSPNNVTGLIAGTDEHNQPIIFHKFVYKPNDPSLYAEFAYGTDEVLLLNSGLQTPILGSFYISRKGIAEANSNATSDASLVLNLNTSRLFTVNCSWTQDFTDRLQETLGEHVDKVRARARSGLDLLWTASAVELFSKSKLVVRSLADELEPIATEAAVEMDAMWTDVEGLQKHLEHMYDDNDFLMRDIMVFLEKWSAYAKNWLEAFRALPVTWSPHSVSQFVDEVLHKLSDFVKLFTNALHDWSAMKFHQTLESFSRALSAANDLWSGLGARLYTGFENVSSVLANASSFQSPDLSMHFNKLSSLGENLASIWRAAKSLVTTVRHWFKSRWEMLVSWVLNSEVYVYIHERVVSSLLAVRHFLTIQIFDYLNRFMIEIKRFMSPEQQKLMDDVQSNLVALRDVIWTLPDAFVRHPIFGEIADMAIVVYQKTLWTLHYYKLLPNGWQTLITAYMDVTYLFETKVEVASDGFDSQNHVLLDMEGRKFEMVQALPFPWTTLRQWPHFGQTSELRYLRRLWKRFQAADYDTRVTLPAAAPTTFVPSFFVWWNDVSDRLDVGKWLPPFPARAMLIGHQHYVSFDDRITDFAGPCSYLLTRDFVDGNFTVSINYDAMTSSATSSHPARRRSLSVWLDDQEIELVLTSPPSPQVYVDGRKVELPQHFGRTSIVRDVHRLTIVNGYGFSLSCQLEYDVCTFGMSGWYLGRVGGLLGTYNYEAHDDVRLPDGHPPDGDLARWGDAWRMDAPSSSASTSAAATTGSSSSAGGCSTPHNLAVAIPRKDAQGFGSDCIEHFNMSRSIFRFCFDKVDPLPYFQMCLSDAQHSHDSPRDICSVAAAYVDRCLAHNVPVRIPKLCVQCVLPDGGVMSEGHSSRIEPSADSKKADVVFIVEAKKCNRNFPKIYEDFVAAVDNALARASVAQRRFATVIFGGSGFHDEPRIHTVDSQIFVGQRLISGLPNFLVGRGTAATVFDAFRFAAKLPFEAGASKTFVLVACSVGDDVEMKTDYPEVHWLLLEDGITLHLLLDREFDTKKPHTFYGMDGQRAYTAKDARTRELKGDEDLRRQVAPPKDFHVPIAFEVNGTVFSSARLYGRSPGSSSSSSSSSSGKQVSVKRFLDVFGRRLAQSASADVCHHCECFPSDDVGVGRLYCHPCVFPKPCCVYQSAEDFDFEGVEEDFDDSSLLQPGSLDKKSPNFEDDTSGTAITSTSSSSQHETSGHGPMGVDQTFDWSKQLTKSKKSRNKNTRQTRNERWTG